MSNAASPATVTTSTMQRRPVPANFLLLADLLHMLVAATLLSMFLFVGTEIPLLIQLAITILILVVMVRGGGWLVLGAMQVSMFFNETRADYASIDLPTIVFGVFCLALVAYATGFPTIRRLLREWLGGLLHELIVAPPSMRPRTALAQWDAQQDQQEEWLWVRMQSWQLCVRVARLLIIVLVASIAFFQLPFTLPGIRAWWDRTVAMEYVLWPGPNVFVLAIVCLLVLTIGAWRRLSAMQARLYIKSLYVREHFRELRSVLVRGKHLSGPLRDPLVPAKTTKPLTSVK